MKIKMVLAIYKGKKRVGYLNLIKLDKEYTVTVFDNIRSASKFSGEYSIIRGLKIARKRYPDHHIEIEVI